MSSNNGLGDVKLHYVDNVDMAQKFISWLGERRPHDAVAFDLETGELPGNNKKDALSPWHGRIRLAQIGDGQQGWAIPWDEWKGVFYQGMNNYTGSVVCHNIAFEAKWMAIQSKWEMPWHKAHDTMLMSQVVDPNLPAGLKTLASMHIDAQAVNMQRELDEAFAKNGWTWGTIPVDFQPYWVYGALDPVITMRLWEKYWKTCAPGQMYSIPYEIEMATRKIATKMELNGARIDLEYSQRKLDQLIKYTDDTKAWAARKYGGVSITSNVQLVGLFEKLGAEITSRTKTGQKSMTKEELKLLSNNGIREVKELATAVLGQRKADKLASSYFSNFLNDNIEGYVHPSIRTMGARTGRMSITDPALQTLPSGDAAVRRAFIPKDEDHVIIASDLDQVEFRLTANMSQDDPLIELFLEADRTGGDVFTSIMQQVYDDPTLVKADPRRKLIKGVVYGKLYGAGPEKMAETAGVPIEVMKDVVLAFDSSYPGVKTMQKEVENIGMRRLKTEGVGYVTTRTGRRLPCDEDRVYSLTNYLVQASAAEIFKQNLIKLDAADLTEMMIVPVHDEIVMQVPREDAAEIMPIVQECMTTTEGWRVPLTSGVEGPFENWGSKYEEAH